MTTIVRAEDPPIVKLLKSYEADITDALPVGYTPGRFKSVCVNQLRSNPDLLKCDPLSFVSCVLMAAQLGLEPGGQLGLSWLIPRRIDGKWTATFQLGYQGLRQLSYRSGVVAHVEARIVYEGDIFKVKRGRGGTDWTHEDPLETPDRQWTHVYATARTVMGAEPFESMSKAQVLAHRDRYVPQWQKSKAWREQEPEMARKTVLARLARQLPMSVEFRTAMVADGMSPREIAPDLAGLAALEAGIPDDEDQVRAEGDGDEAEEEQ